MHEQSKRYPELERFASHEDAKKSLNAWQKELLRKPKFWLVLIGYTAGAGLLVAGILIALRQWVLFPRRVFIPLVVGITGGSGMVVVTWFWRHQCRRYLRQQLAANGIPICIKCGYDLQGQVEPRCSECGTPFHRELLASSSDS